ncbi:MAG: DUF362 domain-containing protein [Thermodesulfobacteriota bacterium]
MKSKVYFVRLKHKQTEIISRINILLKKVWPPRIGRGDMMAIKIHFGERGNTAFIKPVYVRRVVECLKKRGVSPFLTDTNTLYKGTRSTTPVHIATALKHGFDFDTVMAPIVIADGLKGENYREVEINRRFYKTVKIGTEIIHADALIALTHFKGHELTGFGGTLKNIGMGCACREGKLSQHSTAAPLVHTDGCIGCGTCVENCAFNAISIIEKRAVINPEICTGCSQCIVVCPEGVIRIQWNESTANVQKKIAEYALGVLKNKEEKFLCLNFLTDITPACDCWGYSAPPIMKDIGVLASQDPVAIDQASIDLVNADGKDRFREIYPEIDWGIQLSYGESIGMGRREYELIEI